MEEKKFDSRKICGGNENTFKNKRPMLIYFFTCFASGSARLDRHGHRERGVRVPHLPRIVVRSTHLEPQDPLQQRPFLAEVHGPRHGGDGAYTARRHALHHRVLVQGPPRPALGGVSPHRRSKSLVRRPGLALHRLLHSHETAGADILSQKENMAAI